MTAGGRQNTQRRRKKGTGVIPTEILEQTSGEAEEEEIKPRHKKYRATELAPEFQWIPNQQSCFD